MFTVSLGQANQTRFHAKEHGRNRTCSLERLIAEEKINEKAIWTGTIEPLENT